MQTDISTRADIEQLVNEFYNLIKADAFVGPVFNEIIKDNWPTHLEKMYRFWETVLLGNHSYSGAPFMPHARLPLTQMHFDKWLNLFNQTVNFYFSGPVAEEAKERAAKMALMFLSKINYIKENNMLRPLA